MPRNQGLGKLRGAANGKERKSRIDRAIEEDTGTPPPKPAAKKVVPKKKK